MEQALAYRNKVVQEQKSQFEFKLRLLEKHKALVAVNKQVILERKAQNRGIVENVDYDALFAATTPSDLIPDRVSKALEPRARPPPPTEDSSHVSVTDLY